MTNLDPEICYRLKKARREAKLSQIDVANEIGCKQSALSMFEQGDGTKLNDEAISKLSRKFGVDISKSPKTSASDDSSGMPADHAMSVTGKGVGFCPNPHCPTNRTYEIEGRTFHLPDRSAADPVGGRFCALCGEVLVKVCPNCGAHVHDGGFCSICGDPYVAVTQ